MRFESFSFGKILLIKNVFVVFQKKKNKTIVYFNHHVKRIHKDLLKPNT